MNKIIIDWSHIPTYTTIMAVCAGSSLISVSSLGKKVLLGQLDMKSWALNFAALGTVLLITSSNMVLRWPLGIPFDNIVFGETSMGLSMLDLALAFYLWKRSASFGVSDLAPSTICKELSSFRTVITGLGLGLVAIACAAYQYKFFIAPKEEPLGGDFAAIHPLAENVIISSFFLITGFAALLTVRFLSDFSVDNAVPKWHHKINYLVLRLSGWFFLMCGVVVFYTHIGLIIHTMR